LSCSTLTLEKKEILEANFEASIDAYWDFLFASGETAADIQLEGFKTSTKRRIYAKVDKDLEAPTFFNSVEDTGNFLNTICKVVNRTSNEYFIISDRIWYMEFDFGSPS